ncbi:unnamed protein product [Adineta ricciae]|uniref:Uncharacterized protein n=1 Tax=Adineta ricciae TaxID=249248 RepID=A0A814HKV9_ADIRI|nr:unnamed protein product [Adineta ricciae]
MSSTASDPTQKTLLDVVTNSISQLQRKQIFNKDRLQSIRRFICQSIGLTILLYFIFRIPILLYALLKVLFQSLVYLLTIIFWPYVKLLEFFLPKTTNYGILFPLFLVISILSFLTAKLSSRKGYKNSPFSVVFVVLIIAQSVFVLRPIALSIDEQRKLPLSPSINKETITRLSAKTDEHTATVDQNNSIQMSSARIIADSDMNGKHSNSIREHKTQPRLVDETLSADVLSENEKFYLHNKQIIRHKALSNDSIDRSNDQTTN